MFDDFWLFCPILVAFGPARMEVQIRQVEDALHEQVGIADMGQVIGDPKHGNQLYSILI